MSNAAWTRIGVACACALLAALAGGTASAHRDPCHASHTCPSDHHTYPWRGLSCTSYPDEHRPSDRIAVTFGGRRYWCSRTTDPDQEPGGACGSERWAVKTLSDPLARSVDFRPRPATVHELLRIRRPAGTSASVRVRGVETTTYRMQAALVGTKLEDDRDVHLVVADPGRPGETMILELPEPGCAGAVSSPKRAAMARARAAFVAACGRPTASFRRLRGTATIVGVGFFDSVHGQTGVAPNGIELHPLLSFSSADCG